MYRFGPEKGRLGVQITNKIRKKKKKKITFLRFGPEKGRWGVQLLRMTF